MARIRPPKDFKIIGPWMVRDMGCPKWKHKDRTSGQRVCDRHLQRLFGSRIRKAQKLRLTLSTSRARRGSVRIILLRSHSQRCGWEGSRFWWSPNTSIKRPRGAIGYQACQYLLRKFRKFNMNHGDTITLWLSAETR